MDANEREQNIVNLINQLAEYADDETTTQEAMNNIMEQIKQKTRENIQAELDSAEEYEHRPKVMFPVDDMTNKLNEAINAERSKMISDIEHTHDHLIKESEGIMNNVQGQMLFTRIREVKRPGKAHPTDAGIDFYVPDAKAWDDEFKDMVVKYSRNSDANTIEFTDTGMTVPPNAHVAIPSGIKTIIPPGFGMMFVNKSGIATKLKLDHSACLVDSEYRDEIVMCFFNHNTEPVSIEPGMKITQGLIVPIINLEINEVLNCVYDDMGKDTDRGGGFGSSGTK